MHPVCDISKPVDSTFRSLSLSSEQYIGSVLDILELWRSTSFRFSRGHLCTPRANCRSKVTYFKERKRTDYLGTRGILEDDSRAGRTSSTHSSRVSLLFRWLSSILSPVARQRFRRFRHSSSSFSATLSLHYHPTRDEGFVFDERVPLQLPPSSPRRIVHPRFLIRHLVAISRFSSPEVNRLASRGRGQVAGN